MKISKWLIAPTLAAAIAFTSLSVIASADEAEMPAKDPAPASHALAKDFKRPMQEHIQKMKTAVENGDYQTFAELAPERLLEVINEDNFSKFQEMHNHRQAAREIAEELGLPQRKMHKHKFKNPQMLQKQQQMGQRMGINR